MIEITVSIAIHKKNMALLRQYFTEKCKHGKAIPMQFRSESGDTDLSYSCYNDIYDFYAIEYLENYFYSCIYANLFYYPESEKENKQLIETGNIITRRLDYNGLIHLPNIFSYDENKMIDYMEKELSD